MLKINYNHFKKITANHWGFFEFGICNVDNNRIDQDATQECLDKNKLFDMNNKTRINIQKAFIGRINMTLQLPLKFTCKHCVFQVRYFSFAQFFSVW